jgi:hypothetical protein
MKLVMAVVVDNGATSNGRGGNCPPAQSPYTLHPVRGPKNALKRVLVTNDTTSKHPVMGSQGRWTITVLNLVLVFQLIAQ